MDWKLILTEEQINLVNDSVAKQLNERFTKNYLGKRGIVVASILKGAVYFTVDLTRKLTFPHSLYFIEASSYKNEQTQSEELELLSKIIPSKFENKIVILLDELYDNGLTLHQVKNKLLSEVSSLSHEDIFTCVCFKKNKETQYPLPDLVGIDLPNVWLVGYGLDDQQTKRNLKDLYGVPKTSNVLKTKDDDLFENEEGYNQHLATIKNDISYLKISHDYIEDLLWENEYFAYNPPRGYGTTTLNEAMNFYRDLTEVLTKIANDEDVSLPENTSLYSLPDFVAIKMPLVGAKALYKLGFRAGKYETEENYECCDIIHPDGREILYECGKQQYLFTALHHQLNDIKNDS